MADSFSTQEKRIRPRIDESVGNLDKKAKSSIVSEGELSDEDLEEELENNSTNDSTIGTNRGEIEVTNTANVKQSKLQVYLKPPSKPCSTRIGEEFQAII